MRLLCARQSEPLGSSPIDVCMCVTSGKVQVIDEVFLRVFHSSVQMHHASLRLMEQGQSICRLLHVQSGEPPDDACIDLCVCVSLFKRSLG